MNKVNIRRERGGVKNAEYTTRKLSEVEEVFERSPGLQILCHLLSFDPLAHLTNNTFFSHPFNFLFFPVANDSPHPFFCIDGLFSQLFFSSNIYYEIIYNELLSGFLNKYTEIVFWNILIAFLLHTPWHRPLLAQPGP